MLHKGDGTAKGDSEGKMMAVVTTGTGGYDKLDYRRVSIPVPGSGEVALSVLAAGVNNTDIITRLGWYSESVRGAVFIGMSAQEPSLR
ncbi:hypothetical protein [Defluviimonas sp. SAOS-178_SWC]|uniref:hypothetical protein n=1 Tax=Defluviimonas sp. SAOS-178_SWC TaxID=3121287 RepID=UPI003221B132